MHEGEPARAERARVLLGRHRARAPRIAAAENSTMRFGDPRGLVMADASENFSVTLAAREGHIFARMWARARATRARAARGFAGASKGHSDAEPRCLYAILRVSPDATDAQIKDGFRRAAKRLHPDALARGDANEADARTDTFVRAVAAYEILSCERRRALYDAERSSRWLRAPSGGFAASAGASETSEDEHDPWASLFRHSEVLRDYRGAVHALVPRAALRRELYTALARVLGGPQLDVEAVLAGARWPKYFEAEERASVAAAERGDDPAAFRTQGVDLMHVVSGRTLLAAVRERRVEAIEWTHTLALRGDANGDEDGDANGDERDANGDEIENDPGDERPPSPGTPPPSRPSPDAVLELVIDGRVAATATRLVPGGDVTVRANVVEGDPDAPPEASLLAADLDNWAGRAREDDSSGDADSGADADSGGADSGLGYRARGPNGEACVVSGLVGSFNRAEIRDADGVLTHVVVAHATPGVTHLHWFDATRGTCVGRATRAWMPPGADWLAAPRSVHHANGGWYFELPPGPPRATRRVPEHRRIPGPAASRHVFDEFRDDFTEGLGLGFGFGDRGRGVRFGNRAGASRAKPTAVPPAAAIFTAAFRTLDRERGENHGVEGAMRRAWTSVFGARD